MSETKDQVVCLKDTETAIIAAGSSLSSEITLGGLRLFGLDIPAGLTGAVITFEADIGFGFRPLKDTQTGTEITYTLSANGVFPLPNPALFSSLHKLKVRTGTLAAPIVQGAGLSIGIAMRAI